jgi:ribokinase
MGKVVVVGSLNCDLVMRVGRLPGPGETVLGSSFDTFVGGKGCNQAIAAARAGAEVAMVGRVGADAYGDVILSALVEAGVEPDNVQRSIEGTGVAQIFVDDRGSNLIGVAPRANGALTAADVEAALRAVGPASVLLLQLEISVEAATTAARRARAAGAKVVLNPAPAREATELGGLLGLTDVVLPNETEAARLAGAAVEDLAGATAAARRLQELGPPTVVLTLGERGALLLAPDGEPEVVPPFPVEAVDTTAAGDAFAGAFAAALAAGTELREAVRRANAAGALACTRFGAEPSLPKREAIERLLAQGT